MFPTLSLSLSLTYSHSFPDVVLLSKKGYVQGQNIPRQVIDIHTSHLPFIPPSTSVSLSSPSSSPCLPVSHSHPAFLFVPLSSPGVNALFPTVLTVPSRCLSHPSCSYGNQRATMLGNIITLAQKEISLLPAESCGRTELLLNNFHML